MWRPTGALESPGNQVPIGVDRPRDMAVHRAEVVERIQGDAAPEPVHCISHSVNGEVAERLKALPC